MKTQSTLLKLTALAVFCSQSAFAGTLSVTTQTHSTEGIVGVTDTQTSNSISYTLGAAYTADDRVIFTFNEDIITNTAFDGQIVVDAVDSADANSAVAGLVLGLLNSSGSTVTYRVTSVSQPDDTPGDGGTAYTDRSTLGAVVTLGSVKYSLSSISSGDLTMSVASSTDSGSPIDTDANGTLATKKTQFGSVAIDTKFDNVIDVATVRKTFVTGTTDTVSWTISNPDTTGWSNLATVNASSGTVVTVKGESGKLNGLNTSQFTVANSGTVAFDESADSVAVTYAGDVKTDTLTFTPPTGDSAVSMNVQSFTTDVVYNYTSAGGTAGAAQVATAAASGEWKLNGASVVIPYMPYSSNASQIIYVTNTGTQTGDIRVTAFDPAGNDYDVGVVSTIAGGQLVKLGPSLLTKLQAIGFTAGKLTLTVTVDVPNKDVIVYASYNVGGSDRGFVQTDQLLPDRN